MRNLKPRLAALAPRIGYAPGDDKAESRYRHATQHWQAWYHSRRWRKLRWKVLTRDLFTCRLCHHVIADTSQLVCDHITPHKGDHKAFWRGPFQTLCKPCHDGWKQSSDAKMHG